MEKLDLDDSWKEIFTKIGYLGSLGKAMRIVSPELTIQVEAAVENVLQRQSESVQSALKQATLFVNRVDPKISEVEFQSLKEDYEVDLKTGQELYE